MEEIKITKAMEKENIEAVLEGTVKAYGTGAHTLTPRRYIDKRVKIIIFKDE